MKIVTIQVDFDKNFPRPQFAIWFIHVIYMCVFFVARGRFRATRGRHSK